MVETLRRQVIVGEGGSIEIRDSSLRPGSRAEVVILQEPPVPPSGSPPPLTSLIGSCKGMFRSRQEVDEYLRGERESWDD
jgi:hypothetical protein